MQRSDLPKHMAEAEEMRRAFTKALLTFESTMADKRPGNWLFAQQASEFLVKTTYASASVWQKKLAELQMLTAITK